MVKIGQYIKIISNISGHNYALDNIYKVVSLSQSQCRAIDPDTKWVGNYISQSDFILIYKKENQIERITELEKKLKDIQRKKEYLKVNKLQQSDVKLYNVNTILSIANSDIDEKSKVENIYEIINNS
jgi:hypothetical protein